MQARFGKFDLVERIAEGGIGEVFLARQQGLGGVERLVVLKRLRSSLAESPHFEELFLREARISARLSHPNVVQCYEFGRADNSYYLTLEHVRGLDLEDISHRLTHAGRPWPIDVAVETLTQASAGLGYVHVLADFDGTPMKIVHRDVSPANIMMSREGLVKVLDFGVAHVRGTIEGGGTITGKYPYLSPEQCLARGLDSRSDLFSLGAVFYELLTGISPFRRESKELTLRAVLEDPIAPPSSLRRDIPAEVDALCMLLLERDSSRRAQSADAVQAAGETLATQLSLATGPRLLASFMKSLESVSDSPPGVTPDMVTPLTGPSTYVVLAVDDEIDNLQAMERTFRPLAKECTLITASDPLEALHVLESRPVDVLLADQRMPNLTGLELIRRANAIRPNLLKVVVSAFVDAGTLIQAINDGRVHRFVVKPWQPQALIDTVRGLIRNRPPDAADIERTLRREAMTQGVELPLEHTPTIDEDRPRQWRAAWAGEVRNELNRALAYADRVALVLIALDSPVAARLAANWLRSRVDAGDHAIATRGDRVAVILLGSRKDDAVSRITSHLEEATKPGCFLEGGRTPALGASAVSDDAHDADDALIKADMALAAARLRRG